MGTMRLTIKGSLGQISAVSFAFIIDHSLRVLRDLDRRTSEERLGTIKWVVAGLGEGSLYVDLATRTTRGDVDHAPAVIHRFTTGLDWIQREGATPPYFSHDNVVAIRDIVRQFARDGVAGVDYRTSDGSPVELSRRSEPELEKLVGVRYRALGSIEGRVELVSVRRGARRFNITHHRTLRAIRCNLPEELEESIFEAIKERRRVVATGQIAYNAKNEPIRLEVKERLRFLGRAEELPTVDDLAGSDREITGPMSTEDFVRSLRG
jgi:hypothetical protein